MRLDKYLKVSRIIKARYIKCSGLFIALILILLTSLAKKLLSADSIDHL